MGCKRCGGDEDRIDGFCSVHCEEMHEERLHYEEIVDDLKAKLAEAERERDEARQLEIANANLAHHVADMTLENLAMRDVVEAARVVVEDASGHRESYSVEKMSFDELCKALAKIDAEGKR